MLFISSASKLNTQMDALFKKRVLYLLIMHANYLHFVAKYLFSTHIVLEDCLLPSRRRRTRGIKFTYYPLKAVYFLASTLLF